VLSAAGGSPDPSRRASANYCAFHVEHLGIPHRLVAGTCCFWTSILRSWARRGLGADAHRAAGLWVALPSSRRCHRVPSSRDQGVVSLPGAGGSVAPSRRPQLARVIPGGPRWFVRWRGDRRRLDRLIGCGGLGRAGIVWITGSSGGSPVGAWPPEAEVARRRPLRASAGIGSCSPEGARWRRGW
jgi:hypothetical protein